jgi:sirohydrochlorin ferrochelatase
MPHLLIAAHGTQSAAGSATTAAVVSAVAAARPGLSVSVGFLDVAAPSLTQALDGLVGPVVVVPLLLSSGYHVVTDIPAVVAGRPAVGVARHLGPDPALADVLVTRLAAARGALAVASTALVAIGSSRPEARAEVDAMAALVSARIGRPAAVVALFGPVRAALAALPGPVEVATYLLAEGSFLDVLRSAAAGLGVVAEPIGADPALVSLVLARYDAAR